MPRKKPKAPLKLYNVGAPLERVAVDIMGPKIDMNLSTNLNATVMAS
jgi:hypothetical protein